LTSDSPTFADKKQVLRRFSLYIVSALFLIGCKSQGSKPSASSTDSSSLVVIAPEKLSAEDITRYRTALEDLFDRKLLNDYFNGAVIVAKGGTILYENYVGYTNPRTKEEAITDTTAFHLASTSKPFTGMAILRLVQEGRIKLEDDLTKYFPEFPYPNITVKDLLCHRSGLPNYLYFMDDKTKWPADKMVSNQDVSDFMIQHKPAISYKPNTRFNYCNTNYVLLALILEKVTNIPYPQYLKQTIFEPLGMHHTFVYTPADSGRAIFSYRPSGALWELDIFDNTYGDKNIYSTPRDMLKWDAALYDDRFISQALLDSAYQPQSHERPSIHNYGLGWRMLNLPNGKNVIYHNGKWHGFTPAFARLLDEKAVIVILGNKYNQNIYNVAKMAYNVFGDYMQDEGSEDPDSTPPPTVVKRVPNSNVKKTAASNATKNKVAATSTSKKTVASRKSTTQNLQNNNIKKTATVNKKSSSTNKKSSNSKQQSRTVPQKSKK